MLVANHPSDSRRPVDERVAPCTKKAAAPDGEAAASSVVSKPAREAPAHTVSRLLIIAVQKGLEYYESSMPLRAARLARESPA